MDSKVVELADPFSIEVHPREADVFIGYSTTQGQISPIHREEGTDFFQVHLCVVFKKLFGNLSDSDG